MSHLRLGGLAMTTAMALLLAACGQQGPLYLPNEPRDIVTRPSQPQPPEAGATTEAPNSPQTVDSPVSAPPAPEVTAPEEDPEKEQNGAAPPPK